MKTKLSASRCCCASENCGPLPYCVECDANPGYTEQGLLTSGVGVEVCGRDGTGPIITMTDNNDTVTITQLYQTVLTTLGTLPCPFVGCTEYSLDDQSRLKLGPDCVCAGGPLPCCSGTLGTTSLVWLCSTIAANALNFTDLPLVFQGDGSNMPPAFDTGNVEGYWSGRETGQTIGGNACDVIMHVECLNTGLTRCRVWCVNPGTNTVVNGYSGGTTFIDNLDVCNLADGTILTDAATFTINTIPQSFWTFDFSLQ